MTMRSLPELQKPVWHSEDSVQMAGSVLGSRQDSRHRGPEEGWDEKHAYSLTASTTKMDWPCYKYA